MYGRSAGFNRANGAAGYGIPLGEVFFYGGTAVQRFGRGRMIITREGSRFSFEQDTSGFLLESLDEEKKDLEFGGRNIPPEVSNAFAYSWAFVFSGKEGESDGPVTRVTFPRPWIIQTGGTEIAIKGFFYKSYNNAQDVLVLVDSEHLPLRARFLSGPFLSAVLSRKRLPGLGTIRLLGSAAGTGLGRSLAEGFALYGPPLSDPLPRLNQDETTGEASEALFVEAQRFARGWIVVRNVKPPAESGPNIESEAEIDRDAGTEIDVDADIRSE